MKWDIATAPLARERLNSIGPLVRILGGILFLAWSWVSTVFIIGWLLEPIIKGGLLGIGYSYYVGFGFAVFVTIVEWVTQERFFEVHWAVVLILDAPFTAWQTHEWITTIATAKQIPVEGAAVIGLWGGSIICGIIAAKFGEVLLLSSQKRKVRNAQPQQQYTATGIRAS